MKTLGFPRMHKEANEKRDFLPEFFKHFIEYDAKIYMEEGYGSGMGLTEEDYIEQNPQLVFVSNKECYEKDIVVVLRCPEIWEMDYMKEGSILVSMLHYPTRLTRVEYLKKRNIFGIAMDLIRNDLLERIVVDYKGTSGNGVKIGFKELEKLLRHNNEDQKEYMSVSIMGTGMVGLMAAKFAGKFGGKRNTQLFNSIGVNSVITNMLPRNTTSNRELMEKILSDTDILIDATTRDDSSKYIVNNDLLGSLKKHAVILDLTADPYLEEIEPMQVKAIEGLPTGTLDKYVFYPDDKAFELIPQKVRTNNRRTVVGCNAWPGVNPERCMKLYGVQMTPIIKKLITQNRMQLDEINDDFFMRAIYRSTIEYFENTL